MKTHTPGPWYYRPEEPSVEAEFNNDGWFVTIADCGKSNHIISEQMRANARLIAAAPEMFEALRAILDSTETTLGDGGSILGEQYYKMADDILAKLEGNE